MTSPAKTGTGEQAGEGAATSPTRSSRRSAASPTRATRGPRLRGPQPPPAPGVAVRRQRLPRRHVPGRLHPGRGHLVLSKKGLPMIETLHPTGRARDGRLGPLRGRRRRQPSEVVIDSRAVTPGGMFVAFAGERVDRNAYLASAASAGAAAAVVASAEPAEKDLEAARAAYCAVLRAEADDCEEFLLRLARAWREMHPDWLVAAVTGSVGKTTTKEMLAACFWLAAPLPRHPRQSQQPDRRAPHRALDARGRRGRRLRARHEPPPTDRPPRGGVPAGARRDRPTWARATSGFSAAARTSRAPRPDSSPACATDGLPRTLALTSSGDFTPFIEGGFARPRASTSCAWAPARETTSARSA